MKMRKYYRGIVATTTVHAQRVERDLRNSFVYPSDSSHLIIAHDASVIELHNKDLTSLEPASDHLNSWLKDCL